MSNLETILQNVTQRKNTLLLGPGGCGKTYSLRKVFSYFESKRVCFITATTGVAAHNICREASTLHSWAGVGIAQGTPDQVLSKVMAKKDRVMRWKKTEVLIIDEISMLGKDFFEKLDYIAKTLVNPNKPFGGITIVASGDFLQLPPVNDDFVFNSQAWTDMNFTRVKFEEPKRFDDLRWFHTLRRIRIGNVIEEDDELLQSRLKAWTENKDEILANDVKPTILYCKRVNVESYNKRQLDRIEDDEIVFESYDYIESKKNRKLPPITLFKKSLDELIPENISLKVGAQVMVRRNFPLDKSLVNGTRGVVTEIHDSSVMVKIKTGEIKCIPMVEFEINLNDLRVVRTQIPLTLAWATTIHKSQGLTLDIALCDIGPSVFAEGQAYVALSRVKNIDGLFLKAYDKKAIFANEESLKYENQV